MRLVLLASLSTGCLMTTIDTGPDLLSQALVTDYGPQISIDEGTDELRIDDETNTYHFWIEASTLPGTSKTGEQGKAKDYPAVALDTPIIVLAGFTVPPLEFEITGSDVIHDADFKQHGEIVIPASFAGQTVTAHIQAIDERGLRSEASDFTVTLTPP